jgi:hypothetical protein
MVWAIAFLEAGWSIQWMKWDVFVNILLSGNFSHITNMSNLQLMAGGLSLAIDYMHVPRILIYSINL